MPNTKAISGHFLLSFVFALFAVVALDVSAGAVVKVPAWARHGDGSFEMNLPVEDLQAWVEGRPVKIRSVQGPGDGLILLIVMDVVGDLNRIDAARNALSEALTDFGPKHYGALLQAQDGLQVIQDPTDDHELLKDKLAALSVSGFPGLLESVEGAAAIGDSILESSNVRVAVLYITDGSIYDYRGDYTNPVINRSDRSDLSRRFRDRLIQERISRTLDALTRSWTPLFFLHLENRNDSLNVVYQNGLAQFAKATGGEALFCNSVAQVPAYLDQLVGLILNLYTLGIESPKELEGRAKLEVVAGSGIEVEHRSQIDVMQEQKPKTKHK